MNHKNSISHHVVLVCICQYSFMGLSIILVTLPFTLINTLIVCYNLARSTQEHRCAMRQGKVGTASKSRCSDGAVLQDLIGAKVTRTVIDIEYSTILGTISFPTSLLLQFQSCSRNIRCSDSIYAKFHYGNSRKKIGKTPICIALLWSNIASQNCRKIPPHGSWSSGSSWKPFAERPATVVSVFRRLRAKRSCQ